MFFNYEGRKFDEGWQRGQGAGRYDVRPEVGKQLRDVLDPHVMDRGIRFGHPGGFHEERAFAGIAFEEVDLASAEDG